MFRISKMLKGCFILFFVTHPKVWGERISGGLKGLRNSGSGSSPMPKDKRSDDEMQVNFDGTSNNTVRNPSQEITSNNKSQPVDTALENGWGVNFVPEAIKQEREAERKKWMNMTPEEREDEQNQRRNEIKNRQEELKQRQATLASMSPIERQQFIEDEKAKFNVQREERQANYLAKMTPEEKTEYEEIVRKRKMRNDALRAEHEKMKIEQAATWDKVKAMTPDEQREYWKEREVEKSKQKEKEHREWWDTLTIEEKEKHEAVEKEKKAAQEKQHATNVAEQMKELLNPERMKESMKIMLPEKTKAVLDKSQHQHEEEAEHHAVEIWHKIYSHPANHKDATLDLHDQSITRQDIRRLMAWEESAAKAESDIAKIYHSHGWSETEHEKRLEKHAHEMEIGLLHEFNELTTYDLLFDDMAAHEKIQDMTEGSTETKKYLLNDQGEHYVLFGSFLDHAREVAGSNHKDITDMFGGDIFGKMQEQFSQFGVDSTAGGDFDMMKDFKETFTNLGVSEEMLHSDHGKETLESVQKNWEKMSGGSNNGFKALNDILADPSMREFQNVMQNKMIDPKTGLFDPSKLQKVLTGPEGIVSTLMKGGKIDEMGEDLDLLAEDGKIADLGGFVSKITNAMLNHPDMKSHTEL